MQGIAGEGGRKTPSLFFRCGRLVARVSDERPGLWRGVRGLASPSYLKTTAVSPSA
jgi:hypothetical protein